MNPSLSTTDARELWAGIAAAAAAAFVFFRKLIKRKVSDRQVTRSEFLASQEAMRNRIGASHLALAEKMDEVRNDLLSAISAQSAAFERRIDQLEANTARLDERTKAL